MNVMNADDAGHSQCLCNASGKLKLWHSAEIDVQVVQLPFFPFFPCILSGFMTCYGDCLTR